jgi:uncharacterized protein (DUF2249 family)
VPLIFKRLDVRRILAAGHEPYPEIRKRVDALLPNEGLSVLAPFLPSPLIEKLSGEGFRSHVERQKDGAWMVHFYRDES